MRKIFATIFSACCLCITDADAHEEVQDEISAPTLKENAAYLQLLQQAASSCKDIYIIIEDYMEQAEYIATLSDDETHTMRRLIAAMRPCATNMDVDIDPSRCISICFKDNSVLTIDEIEVARESDAEPDGSYLLRRFILTDSEYTQWQNLLESAMQRKIIIPQEAGK